MELTPELKRQKAHALKAYRTAIRLKYALLADDEIMRRLPELEKRIHAAIAAGQPLELDPAEMFTEATEAAE